MTSTLRWLAPGVVEAVLGFGGECQHRVSERPGVDFGFDISDDVAFPGSGGIRVSAPVPVVASPP
jgi:hypothetical protein